MSIQVGICTSMNTRGADGVGLEQAEVYKRSGCDYLELPLAQLMLLSKGEREQQLRRARDSGLRCLANNNFFPASLKVAGPKANTVKIQDYAKEAIETAAALGSQTIVFGSGGARNIPTGFSRAEGTKQYAAAVSLAAQLAQPYGITIVIEHLNHFESNIAATFAEGSALAKEIGQPNVGALVDYYHFFLGNEDLALMAAEVSLIKHVHFANPLGRAVPIDRREGDYRAFFDILCSAHYTGRVSIEGYSAEPETDFPRAVALIKELCSFRDADSGS
ncbi:sugar phosphate isomerase/epimerase family protein [Breznakiellaceae bacterium SP9]